MDSSQYCEWTLFDYRTLAPVNHDTYWRIPSIPNVLNFCPVCGKPIIIEGQPIQDYLKTLSD